MLSERQALKRFVISLSELDVLTESPIPRSSIDLPRTRDLPPSTGSQSISPLTKDAGIIRSRI